MRDRPLAPVGPIGPATAVVGVAAADRDTAAAAAHELGLEIGQTVQVAPDRFVISLRPAGRSGGGGQRLSDIEAARLVNDLRGRGYAAVAGPRSDGHAVAWAARNAPIPFSSGACVCFPWSVFDRSRFTTVVEIEPGTGFGAGGHPTTLLLLERLSQLDLAGRRVLDVGCGTGVLAVAAALLGARAVTALDIDPAAIAAAARNIAANGVADRVELIDGALTPAVGSGFDLVLANIVLDVLVSLAGGLRRATAPNGLLAVSGLSPAQPSTLAAELAPMVPTWTDERADWVAAGFVHPRADRGVVGASGPPAAG